MFHFYFANINNIQKLANLVKLLKKSYLFVENPKVKLKVRKKETKK